MKNIIELQDGVLVEIQAAENYSEKKISSSKLRETSLSDLKPFLKKVLAPVASSYQELKEDISLESAKVTVGIKIGFDGNFILAKTSTEAHVEVELTIKGDTNE